MRASPLRFCGRVVAAAGLVIRPLLPQSLHGHDFPNSMDYLLGENPAGMLGLCKDTAACTLYIKECISSIFCISVML